MGRLTALLNIVSEEEQSFCQKTKQITWNQETKKCFRKLKITDQCIVSIAKKDTKSIGHITDNFPKVRRVN